jgi:hypothetical protein
MKQARVLAHIFECKARGIELEDILESESAMEMYNDEFDKLIKSLDFFKAKLMSSKWTDDFAKKIRCAISLVPANVSEESKIAIRGKHSVCCMGCGSREHQNMKAISLFGCLPVSPGYHPFQKIENLDPDYDVFVNEYSSVLQITKTSGSIKDSVHPHEGGMFVLGDTCHNRALAYNIVENFVPNFMFMADQHIQELIQKGIKMEDDTFYASFEDDAELIHKSFLQLQEIAAKETAEVPKSALSLDESYIKVISKLRSSSYLDKTMSIGNRSQAYFGMLGMIARKPWGHYDKTSDLRSRYMSTLKQDHDGVQTKPVAPPKAAAPPSLFDAMASHVGMAQSTSGSEMSDSSEVRDAVVQPRPNAASKRPLSEAQSSDSPGPSTEDAHASKRSKLIDHLEKIKDRLKKSGHLADALAVMEAVAELHK